MSKNPLRVVIAKAGLDGHDRGAKVITRALRDAGVEVIYTGLHQTPSGIVSVAVQEDAHAIGVSCLSGAHLTAFGEIVRLLKEQGAQDITLFGGGIVPRGDLKALKDLGVAEIFTPGASLSGIVTWVLEHIGSPALPGAVPLSLIHGAPASASA
ncbi:cobalamin B12-binding domain-containing protein [Streptomyces sp. DSM 116496]|uniref:cobalamin B12-binding domain-containing protein n=1 Tax=Streptomyces stoeckheimensis TaxID=3344656 RepID=UPI0038B3F68F